VVALIKLLEQLRDTAPRGEAVCDIRPTKSGLAASLAMHLAAMEMNGEMLPKPKQLAAAQVIATGRGLGRVSIATAACKRWEKALLKAKPLIPRWRKRLEQETSPPF
jgi:hypothetical protein